MVRDELMEHTSRRPDDINVGSDGVTVDSKSKQVFTVSRGEFSAFYCFYDLGSFKHNIDVVVKDHVKVSAVFVFF